MKGHRSRSGLGAWAALVAALAFSWAPAAAQDDEGPSCTEVEGLYQEGVVDTIDEFKDHYPDDIVSVTFFGHAAIFKVYLDHRCAETWLALLEHSQESGEPVRFTVTGGGQILARVAPAGEEETPGDGGDPPRG